MAHPDGSATGVLWRITYTPSGADPADTGLLPSTVYADLATGLFRIDEAMPGPVSLEAISDQAEAIPGPVIRVVSGQETRYDFVYRGPDLASRIVVTVEFPVGHGGGIHEDIRVAAQDELGGAWSARRLQSGGVRFAFDDLPDGQYEIEVKSERCSIWSKTGVRPGESVKAPLDGSASLSLVVVDEETGSLIDTYGVETRYEGEPPSTWKRVTYGRRFEPEKGDILRRLVPPVCTLVFDAEGFLGKEVRVDDLRHGERRELRVELERTESAAGTGGNIRAR